MKISVVVIAHNEEAHIEECIESLLKQTVPADEIIVINHNSTDRTGELARTFPVTVIDYKGSVGSVFARNKGFETAIGDIICCIDGDGAAAPNWIETLSGLLEKDVVMSGSWVQMTGNILATAASWRWYFFCLSRGKRATDYMYGASFAIRGEYKEYAIQSLEKGRQLSEKLHLKPNPDDYWLSLFMLEKGDEIVTNKTWVKVHAKETTNSDFLARTFNAWSIRAKMLNFIKKHKLSEI